MAEAKSYSGNNWQGLWRKGMAMNSKLISKKSIMDLPGRVRLVVAKNRYYKRGSNLPSYIFAFVPAKTSDWPGDIDVHLQTLVPTEKLNDDDREFIETSEAISIIKRSISDMEYGDSADDVIPCAISDVMHSSVKASDIVLDIIYESQEGE